MIIKISFFDRINDVDCAINGSNKVAIGTMAKTAFRMSSAELNTCREMMTPVMNGCRNDGLSDPAWSTELLLDVLGGPNMRCIFSSVG